MTEKPAWMSRDARKKLRSASIFCSGLAWLFLFFSGIFFLPGVPWAQSAESGGLSVNPGSLHLKATLGEEVATAVSVAGGSAPYVFSVNGVGSVDDLTVSSPGSTYYRYTISPDDSPGEAKAVIQVIDGEGNTAECPVTIEVRGELAVIPDSLDLNGVLGSEVTASVSVIGGFTPYSLSVSGAGNLAGRRLEKAGGTTYRFAIPDNGDPGVETAVIRVVDAEGNTADCPVTIEIHEALSVRPDNLILRGVSGETVGASVSVGGGFSPYELSVAGAGSVTDERLETAGSTQYRYSIPENASAGEEAAVIRVSDAAGNTVECMAAIAIREALSVKPARLDLRSVSGGMVDTSVSVSGGFPPYELSVAGAGSVSDATLEAVGRTQYRYSVPASASPGEEAAEIRVSDAAGHSAVCPVAVAIHEALSVNPGKLRLKGMLGGGTVVQISVRGGFPPYELSVAGVGSVTDERLETAGTTQYGYLIPGNVSAGEETAVIRVSDAAGHNVTCPVAVEIHEALSVKPVSAGLSGSTGETVSVSVSVEGGFAPYILSVNGPGVVGQARLGESESTVYSYTIPDDSQPGKKRAEIQIRDEQGNIVRCRVSIRIF